MATSKPLFFFYATQSVNERLGDIFNFTWASYAGLRELWWQIRGFHGAHPDLGVREIEEKFIRRIPPPGGVDVRRMFLDRSWDEHEQEFCKQIVFEVCTLYEGWCEKICEDIFSAKTAASSSKALQFPTSLVGGRLRGVRSIVDKANIGRSQLMHSEFFPNIKTTSLNSWSDIDDYLGVYRYFKECRNSLIHSGGRVNQQINTSRNHLDNVQASGMANLPGLFLIPPSALGEKIRLDIRDVILFSSTVRRIIFTLDAGLSVAKECEKILERRLRDLTASAVKWQQLPKELPKLEQRCHRMLSACNAPEPVSIQNVMAWMKSKALI